jgi:hypothetical protein
LFLIVSSLNLNINFLNQNIMSNSDYVPAPDVEFNVWQANLITLVQANTTSWGILLADVTALVALQTTWNTAFTKANNKQNRTSADVQAKDDARKVFEKSLRNFVGQWLARNAKVTDSDRERMGLTVRSTIHYPVPVPETSPLGKVDFSFRGQHYVYFVDDAPGAGKGKPAGVHGCEVWAKVGEESSFSFLGTATSSPYQVKYADADFHKVVSYRLRWVNSKGEQGPWSAIFTAIVVG